MSPALRRPLLRPARPEDLEQILAIERSRPGAPGWARAHFEAELGDARRHLCAAEEGGEVVGYAGLWLLPPEAQVTTVVVRADRAGRGLGRALMEHLHAKARACGCSLSTLEASAANPPALGLYRSLGYAVVGRRAKYYNDGSDALLMKAVLV